MPSLLDSIPVTGLLGDQTEPQKASPRGLLGDSFDDPRTVAVFSAVRGLLSGRRALDGIAAGVGNYGESMLAARQQAAQEQLRRMQIQSMALQFQQQKQAAEQAERDRMLTQKAFTPVQGIEANQASGLAGPAKTAAQFIGQQPAFDPRQFIASGGSAPLAFQLEQSLRKDNTPVKLAAGEALFDPRTFKQIANNPKAQDLPDEVQKYQFAVSQGYRGSFNDYQLALKRAGAQAITVDMRGDNAYSTAQGKEYSDLMAGINKAGFTAPAQLRKLERLSNLLEGVEGGKLAPTGLDVASALNSYGVKIDPRLGNKEAAQALARELAGGLRQPGTGPMTDKDFDNFLTQIPDLSKSAAGRKQITQTMQAALNRDIKVSRLAREYERKHGRIDGGFLDQVSAFIAENPVVAAPSGWVVQR